MLSILSLIYFLEIQNLSSFSLSSYGKGADIIVNTDSLNLSDFANITSTNDGLGQSGDLRINSNSTFINGTPPISFAISSISTNQLQGLSGNLYLKGSKLKICCGGQVLNQNATFNPLEPNPGADLFINVDSIEVNGKAIAVNDPIFPSDRSAIFNSNIGTTSLLNSPSGNISIISDSIKLGDSGSIISTSSGLGNAGNIKINAKNIQLEGTSNLQLVENQTKILTSALLVLPEFAQIFGLDNSNLNGDSGNLEINSDSLKISNEAVLGVLNEGAGNAGTVDLKVSNIMVENAFISATTNGGDGGLVKLIFLDGASISSSSKKIGFGGNININSKLLATKSNSEIVANAENNRAGSIDIDSDILFKNPSSSITANSKLGANSNGEIIINENQGEIDISQDFPVALQKVELQTNW